MEPPTLSDPTLLPLNVPHYFHGRYRSDVVDAGNFYPDPTGEPLVPTRACVPTAIQQCS